MGVVTVRELKEKLARIQDDNVPIYVYDENTSDCFPVELVDDSISGRVELNFSTEPEKQYRVHVAVYHSFTVDARNEDEAHTIASEDVIWDDHITDCSIVIEEEK